MARVEIPFAVTQTSNGAAVTGASVQVNVRGGGPATVYSAETGSTTIPNPLTTTPEGRIEGWVDEGSYNLVVSGGTISTYTQAMDLVRGDGVGRYAPVSVPSGALSTPVLQALLPTGAVIPFAGVAAPPGFLVPDGSAVSRTTYAALFALLGTTFGSGNGSTTFNLPDYRGRVLVGLGTHTEIDTLTDNDGLAVGSRKPKHQHNRGSLTVLGATTSMSVVNSGTHGHSVSDPGHSHAVQVSNNFTFTDNVSIAGYQAPPVGWFDNYGNLKTASTGIGIQASGDHTHSLNDPGHTHTLTGAIGDTAGPIDGAAFNAIQFIIKT